MSRRSAVELIAALRDRLARRVVVVDDSETLNRNDYLALGFERLEQCDDLPAWHYDPDSASLKREWNTARDWANPENFDRYRW